MTDDVMTPRVSRLRQLARRVPMPLRQLPWRLRWLLRNRAFRRSPLGSLARLGTWTARELFQEELALRLSSGQSITTMRNNFVGLFQHVAQEYEPNLISFMKSRLRSGDMFIDVGANVGIYSIEAATCVGRTGRVLAIEANPFTYRFLERNLSVNCSGYAVALNVAVGARDGELPFSFERGDSGSSHVAARSSGATLRVPVRRLDDLLAANDIPRVAYVKIDVEGFEPAVLQGAPRMLAANTHMVLQIEVDRRHLMRYGFTPADLAEPLVAHGFRPHRLSGSTLHAFSVSELAFGDVIWMR